MKRTLNFFSNLALLGLLCTWILPSPALADSSSKSIASYDTAVLGVKIHYVMAGHGPMQKRR